MFNSLNCGCEFARATIATALAAHLKKKHNAVNTDDWQITLERQRASVPALKEKVLAPIALECVT